MAVKGGILYNGVLVSKRTIIELEVREAAALSKYLTKKGAYSTITMNTGISHPTIRKVEAEKKGEVGTVLKLREFISKLDLAGVA